MGAEVMTIPNEYIKWIFIVMLIHGFDDFMTGLHYLINDIRWLFS